MAYRNCQNCVFPAVLLQPLPPSFPPTHTHTHKMTPKKSKVKRTFTWEYFAFCQTSHPFRLLEAATSTIPRPFSLWDVRTTTDIIGPASDRHTFPLPSTKKKKRKNRPADRSYSSTSWVKHHNHQEVYAWASERLWRFTHRWHLLSSPLSLCASHPVPLAGSRRERQCAQVMHDWATVRCCIASVSFFFFFTALAVFAWQLSQSLKGWGKMDSGQWGWRGGGGGGVVIRECYTSRRIF